MKILRGTFRLSILIAAMAAGYFYWSDLLAAKEFAHTAHENWVTLRCGKAVLGNTAMYDNGMENIDFSKFGCSTRQFWGNEREIREALASDDPYARTYNEWMSSGRDGIVFRALGVFVLVNLLGVAVLGARAAVRWVWSGYRA